MSANTNISPVMVSQSLWETLEYVLAALVALACAGESVHEFTLWFSQYTWWKDKGGKASALLLVSALAFEIPTLFKVNSVNAVIIANLSRQEAETRLRAATIERRFAWRTLRNSQQNDIARRMKTLAPEIAKVFSGRGTPESTSLADDIAKALGKDGAGWNVSRSRPGDPFMDSELSTPNVLMIPAPTRRSRFVCDTLAKALNHNGIASSVFEQQDGLYNGRPWCSPARLDQETNIECTQIWVMVGEKP